MALKLKGAKAPGCSGRFPKTFPAFQKLSSLILYRTGMRFHEVQLLEMAKNIHTNRSRKA